jgi:hypothetical protein
MVMGWRGTTFTAVALVAMKADIMMREEINTRLETVRDEFGNVPIALAQLG